MFSTLNSEHFHPQSKDLRPPPTDRKSAVLVGVYWYGNMIDVIHCRSHICYATTGVRATFPV